MADGRDKKYAQWGGRKPAYMGAIQAAQQAGASPGINPRLGPRIMPFPKEGIMKDPNIKPDFQQIAQALAGAQNTGYMGQVNKPVNLPDNFASIAAQNAAMPQGINPRLGPRTMPQPQQGSPGMRPGMTFNRQTGRYVPNQRPQITRPMPPQAAPQPIAQPAPTMQDMQLGMQYQRPPEVDPRLVRPSEDPNVLRIRPINPGLGQLGAAARRERR